MFDRFEKEKRDFLKKKDKSRKGDIDKDIIKLIDKINSKNDFYTTSSCAGRIVLIEMRSSKKYDCHWIIAKHKKVKFKEMLEALKQHKSKNEVWLKQQPIILHVACRNIEAAVKILDLARKIYRRAGIIALNKSKIIVEIIGNENIETIVKIGKIMPDEKYLKELVKSANYNFVKNKKKIGKFLGLAEKLL